MFDSLYGFAVHVYSLSTHKHIKRKRFWEPPTNTKKTKRGGGPSPEGVKMSRKKSLRDLPKANANVTFWACVNVEDAKVCLRPRADLAIRLTHNELLMKGEENGQRSVGCSRVGSRVVS